MPLQHPHAEVWKAKVFPLNFAGRGYTGSFPKSVGLDRPVKILECRFVGCQLCPSFRSPEIGRKCCPSFRLVLLSRFRLSSRFRMTLRVPLLPLAFLFMGINPVRRHPFILNGIDEECGRGGLESGESVRLLVHGGIGHANPALNESPAVLLENPADSSFIDADGSQRLIERIVRYRTLLRCGALGERMAEVIALEELDDVNTLSPLEKQIVRIVVSPAEFNGAVIEQFSDARREIVLVFLEGPVGRKSESMNRQIIDVHENPLGSPESVLEFEEQPPGGGSENPIEVEVKEECAARRLAHLKEHRRPLDSPGSVCIDLRFSAACRQIRREKMQRHSFMLLRHRVVERGVLVRDHCQAFERCAELVILKSADRHAKLLDDPIRSGH